MHYEVDELQKIEIIVNKLNDMILDEEYVDAKGTLFELVELIDLYGNKIFELDDDLHFTFESISLFEKAVESFKENLKVLEQDFTDLDLEYQFILDNLENLLEFFRNEKIIKDRKKTTFIAIPIGKSSALNYDIMGSNCNDKFAGMDCGLKSPHRFKFDLSRPSQIKGKSNGQIILSELDKIENVLEYDACIVNHTGQRRPFQSEGGTQVKRNIAACTRIQINQYGENVVAICGIYHKVGQNDDEVQSEYETRKEVLEHMSKDKNIDIEMCKKAYYDFKKEVIMSVYQKDITRAQAICEYLINSFNFDKRM